MATCSRNYKHKPTVTVHYKASSFCATTQKTKHPNESLMKKTRFWNKKLHLNQLLQKVNAYKLAQHCMHAEKIGRGQKRQNGASNEHVSYEIFTSDCCLPRLSTCLLSLTQLENFSDFEVEQDWNE